VTGHLFSWLQKARDSSVKELNDETFEHVTQAASGGTTGNWIVLFTLSEVSQVTSTFLEGLAARISHHSSVAVVHLKKSPELEKRFKLENLDAAVPRWYFFRHGKMYAMPQTKMELATMQAFTEKTFQNFQAIPTPKQPTPFDLAVEFAVQLLKSRMDLVVAICVAFFHPPLCFIFLLQSKKRGYA